VPHFGEDYEIRATKEHLAQQEAVLGKWDYPKADPDDDIKRNYPVPNFGIDKDIRDSLASLKSQESAKGNWNLSPDNYYQL